MKASKSGTVNAVSPCAGLKIIPLATSEFRRGATVVTFRSRTWATSPDRVGALVQPRSGDARSRAGRVLRGLHPDIRTATETRRSGPGVGFRGPDATPARQSYQGCRSMPRRVTSLTAACTSSGRRPCRANRHDMHINPIYLWLRRTYRVGAAP